MGIFSKNPAFFRKFTLSVVALALVLLTVQVAAASLINYWDCEEGSGTTVLDQQGSTDLGSSPFTYSSTVVSFNTSGDGGSYSCEHDGSGVGATSSATFSGNEISFSMWFYANAADTYFVWFKDASGDFIRLSSNGDRDLYFRIEDDGAGSGLSFPQVAFSLNTWTHYAVTNNKDTGRIITYVDGVVVDNSSTTANVDLTGNLYLGAPDSAVQEFDGLIDEIKIYDHALTSTEVTSIYNYGNLTGETSNFTVSAVDSQDDNNLTGITVTADGTTYTNTTGNKITTTILTNQTSTFNVEVGSISQPYFNKTYTGVDATNNETVEAALDRHPQVHAYDTWSDEVLQNFTYSPEGHDNITTTTGVVHVPYEEVLNYNITTTTHHKGVFKDIDLSRNTVQNHSLNQSIITFRAYELITENEVDANVTINTTTKAVNETFNPSADNYTINASKTGYYSQTTNITVSPQDNRTINLTGLYDSKLTISPRDIVSNSTIAGNNITIESTDYNWSETVTGVENYTFNLTSGDYNITVDSENRSLYQTNHTVTPGATTLYAYTYAYNSLWVRAYDQADSSTITTFNVTVSDDNNSYSESTTTSIARFDDIPSGEYTVSVIADMYSTITYTITMADNSHQTLSAYLSASSDTFKFNIKDSNTRNAIEGASVKQYGYVNDTLTLLSSDTSDIIGTVQMGYTSGTSYYYTVNKDSYNEKTFWLETLYDSYDVLLEKTTTTNEDVIDDDVHWTVNQYSFINNETMWVEALVVSDNGSLTNYTLTIETPNNESSVSGTSPGGGVLNASTYEGEAPFGATVTVTMCYNSTYNNAENCYSRAYPVSGYSQTTGFEKLEEDTEGWGSLEKVLVATLISLVVMAFMAAAGAVMGAGAMMAAVGLLITMGVFTFWTGWVSQWAFYGVALVAGMFIATNIGGGS